MGGVTDSVSQPEKRIVKALLKAGFNPNAYSKIDFTNQSSKINLHMNALSLAIAANSSDMVRLLLQDNRTDVTAGTWVYNST